MRADKTAQWDDVKRGHIFYCCPRWMTGLDSAKYMKLVRRFCWWRESFDRHTNDWYREW